MVFPAPVGPTKAMRSLETGSYGFEPGHADPRDLEACDILLIQDIRLWDQFPLRDAVRARIARSRACFTRRGTHSQLPG